MATPSDHPAVSSVVAASTDRQVVGLTPVGGGDTASAFRVELDDGRVVFAKTVPLAAAASGERSEGAGTATGPFHTEAESLRWLAAAAAVQVPAVLGVSAGEPATGHRPVLVLEWITPGVRGEDTDAAFGTELAALHRAGAPSFGREDRAVTGSLRLPNDPCSSWAEFYSERRLVPLARIARDRGALPGSSVQGLEHLAGRLAELGGPPEPAARLHGDLWAGNRMVDERGRNWLVDPAAVGGHREFDLAMMRLFGGFGRRSFDTYQEQWPLAEGWSDRVALHQLAPLTVHAVKFGGSYVDAVADAIDRYR